MARDPARLPRRVLVPPERPRNGGEAAAAVDERARPRSSTSTRSTAAILLTPFHNMALMSPATTEADVDRHTEVFAEAARELTAA